LSSYDQYATSYSADYDYESVMVHYRRQLVLERVRWHSAKRVLEVGCGLEPLFVHDQEATEYWVLEPSSQFFENAQAKASQHPSARVLKGNLEDNYSQLEGLDFDMVLLSGLLHEVSEPDRLLGAARRLCRSNTMLHVNVPSALSFHRRLGQAAGFLSNLEEISERAVQLQQKRSYSPAALRAAIEESGFRVCQEGGYFFKPFTHKQMSRWMGEEKSRDRIEQGLFELGKQFPDLASEIYCEAKIEGSEP